MKSGFHVLFRMFTRLVRVNKFAFILFALLASSSAWAGTTYKITQEEGSACIYGNYMTSCEIPTEAEEGEVVTLSVVTAERYVLDTVRVYDETARNYLTVTDGKWYDNTASFVMPASDVRVEVRTKSPGSDLYVNMPATGTKKITLPSRMRSFWVYDDGGKNQNYSNNASGTLQLVAPEGHSFGINVKYLNTESGKDKLTVYDGINSTNKLYDGISGDRVETKPFSTGNSIKIFFESNGSTNKSGFEIQIDVEDRGLAGSGTEADPFIIGSENDWDWFRTNVRAGNSYAGQFIRLDADITASGMVGSADKGMAFSGTFDGKGKDGSMHTIMANISDTHSGTALFQYISGATIKNLTVAGSIVGDIHAAGLVGISSGTGNKIENCVVSATVEGGSHIGGVLGNGDKSDITIDNCVFKGKLVGGSMAMGVFFGWGDNGGTKVVKNCLYIPDSKQTFTNLDLVKMDAGSVTVTDCYKMFVSLNTFAALEAYSHISGTMVFPNADNNVWGPSNCTMVEMTAADGTKFYKVASLPGSGTKNDPYVISNEKEWNTFAYYVFAGSNINENNTFAGKFVKLAKDISVTKGVGYIEVNDTQNRHPFSGTFDGDGHTVTVSIGSNTLDHALFNVIDGATIKNLTVAGSINTNHHHAAAVVGYSYGTGNKIENCVVSATVHGGSHIGGILGYGTNSDVTIENCVFKGLLESYMSTYTMGALLGWGDNGGTKVAKNCLYLMQEGQGMTGLDLANMDAGSVTMTDCYKTADAGTYGTFAYMTLPPNAISYEEITAVNNIKLYVVNKKVSMSGSGTEADPYIVSDADKWDELVNLVSEGYSLEGKFLKLGADIDVTKKLGDYVQGKPFSGSFDGGGHTVTVRITDMDSRGVSLFHYIKGATIKNLTVAGYLAGKSFTSGLVGYSDGTGNRIEKCIVTATINGDASSSGFLANALTSDVVIDNCIFRGKFKGLAVVGVFIAIADHGIRTVSNCLYIYQPLESLDNRDWIDLVWAAPATVTECYKTSGDGSQGQLAFLSPLAGFTVIEKTAFDGTKFYPVIEPFSGTGSESDPYIISSESDWNAFATLVNAGNRYNKKFFKLAADISVSKKVGVIDVNLLDRSFSGTFDGNGHTITASIVDFDNYGTALFSFIEGATIKNVVLDGYVVGGFYTAGLVGISDKNISYFDIKGESKIENCIVTATVGGFYYIGGILGNNIDSDITINNCVFKGMLITESDDANKNVFIGWENGSSEIFVSNSLYILQENQKTDNLDLALSKVSENIKMRNCYKTTDVGTYGTRAYLTVPTVAADEIAIEKTAVDGTKFYVINKVLPGDGTSNNPYIISDASDMETFAGLVNGGTSFADKFIRLNADISIDTKIGDCAQERPFAGTFDGDNHTISTVFNDNPGSALFNCVENGATIKNLSLSGYGNYNYVNDGDYVNMPETGTKYVATSFGVTSFKVYDDGGKDGNYHNSFESRYLVMTAPEGYLLRVTGSVATYDSYDCLQIRDGGTNGSFLNSSKIYGTHDDIDYRSTGNTMTLYFYSDASNNKEGLDLTVTVVKDIEYKVTCLESDIGGTASCDKAKAKVGDVVSMTVTPPTGYVFYGYKVVGEGYEKTVNLDECYFETKTVSINPIERPLMDISITPLIKKAHTAEDGLYVNMPESGTRNVTIPSGVTSFKVYDDGGKDGNYSNNSKVRYLVMTAPEGYLLRVTGSVATYDSYDNLQIHDGGTNGSFLNSSKIYGTRDDIDYRSTGNTMALYFYSDASNNKEGLDLTVTVIKDVEYKVTCLASDIGGTASCDKSKAKIYEEVLLTVTPPTGYFFYGYKVVGDGYEKTVNLDGWYSETKTVSTNPIEMPQMDVSITPLFIAKEGLYVNMPESGTKNFAIPSGVTSFKVYDDGGKDGNYHNSFETRYLVMTAPEGYLLRVTGSVVTYNSYDYLHIRDGGTNGTLLNSSSIYGTHDDIDYRSTGNTMTLVFYSDASNNKEGLDLTVIVIKAVEYMVTCLASDIGGTASCDKSKAKIDEEVLLTVTPPTGYLFYGYKVVGNGYEKTVNLDEWYSETKTVSANPIEMPPMDVSITPLFIAKEGLYVNMPESGTKNFAIPSGVTSFKVYDDGGKDGNYHNSLGSRYLVMTAPEGYLLRVTGSVVTYDSYDRLHIRDGGTNGTLLNSSKIYGTHDDIDYRSTGNTMTLDFYSDASNNKEGLDLTVTVIKDVEYKVTCLASDIGGTASCDKSKAKIDEEVLLTVTPPTGYFFYGYKVVGEGYEKTVNLDGWYSETKTVSIERPPMDVSITPLFIAEGGFYVNMPESGTKNFAIPSGVTSFKVYDDGGKDGNYSSYSKAYLVMTAPEGYLLRVTGSVVTYNSSDNLRIYDGGTSGTLLASSIYGIRDDLDYRSTGNTMTLYFYSNGSNNKEGLDLTVTVIKDVEYKVTCLASDIGGTASCDKSEAKIDEEVLLTVTPPTGYLFYGYKVVGNGYEKTVNLDEWYSETKTVSANPIEMPPMDVSITPLFIAKEGLYVNMPESGTKNFAIPSGVTSFKVYDDGGKDGNYSNNSSGRYLVMTAPEGYLLRVTGSVATETGRFDYLQIRDGGINGTMLASSIYGTHDDIDYRSTGNTMTLYFYSDESNNKEGLDLTVTVIKDVEYKVTCLASDIGGTASCDKSKAKIDEEVLLMVTPPTGYFFYGYKVVGDGYEKTVNLDGWFSGTKTVSINTIERPLMDVSITPLFIAKEGLYVNMPESGTKNFTISSGVTSFKVYDDGGKDGNYSNNSKTRYLVMTVPEGYILRVTGSVETFNSNDYLRICDGGNSEMTYVSFISGTRNDIDYHSTGNTMTLLFYSDGSNNKEGLDLTVTVVKDVEYTVTCLASDVGGTASCDKSKAKAGDEVTMTATPSSGYFFYGYKVVGDGYEKTIFDGWYPETKTVSIKPVERPLMDYSVTPLFIAEEGLYVNMPESGTKNVSIPSGVTSFKVYDDGGKDGNYLNSSESRYLVMTAPEGFLLRVTGSAVTYNSSDKLRIYDGGTNGTLLNSSSIYGTHDDIDYRSTGNAMTLYFYSDESNNKEGLDLTVTVVKDVEYKVTCLASNIGGTASCDKSKAKAGDVVTLTATPPTGYFFYGYKVVGNGYEKTVNLDGLYSETKSRSIERPLMDVTVMPLFARSAEDGLYLNMPKSGTKKVTIPSGVTSFKVYDEGGKDGNYANGVDWRHLVMTAPEGYILRVTGSVATFSSNDYLRIRDGGASGMTLASTIYGTKDDIDYHSRGNSMTLDFYSDASDNAEGLDLTVTVVNKNIEYSITCFEADVGGTASCDKSKARADEEVLMMVTSPTGYLFYGYKVVGARYEKMVFDGWYSETKTVSIKPEERPLMDYSVTPLFTKARTAEEGLYVNMPERGSRDVTIPSGVTSFKVYDDGGKDGNYKNYSGWRSLVMTAPEGYLLRVTGSVATYDSYDKLRIYDGGFNGMLLNNKDIYGTRDDIDYHSRGNSMTLDFYSDASDNAEGLDLTVTVVKDVEYKVTCLASDIGGIASCNKTKAKIDEEVLLTVTPPTGYFFYGYKVVGGGYEKTVNLDGWYSETKTVSINTIERPLMDVSITPLFIAKEGLYVNMPESGTKNFTISSGVTSFKVYDDGGKDGNYSNNSSGRYLVMTAPEGYLLRVTGSVVTYNSYDYLHIRDGGTNGTLLNSSKIYGIQDDIDYCSTGNTMTLYFYSDESNNKEGLDLMVTVVKADKPGIITITEADGKKTATIDGAYGGTDALQIDENITVENVVFNREFYANTYSTMVLPFAVNTAKLEGLNAVLYYNGIGTDKKGNDAVRMKVLWATREWSEANDIPNADGKCCKVYGDSNLTANTPYLVQMGGTTLKVNGPVTIVPTTEAAKELDGWKFRGMWEFKRWDTGDRELGYAYGFAASAPKDSKIEVGDFVKIGEGTYIYPLRAYLVSSNIPESSSPVQSVRANGAYAKRPTVVQKELPELISVIVDDEGDGKQTTVIGHFNTRTGEFKMNNDATKRTFDVKGRRVNGEKSNARGAYYGKKTTARHPER